MGKRLTNLSPVGEVVASELAALQVTVVDFCREAHISRVTYYKLLFGKTSGAANEGRALIIAKNTVLLFIPFCR